MFNNSDLQNVLQTYQNQAYGIRNSQEYANKLQQIIRQESKAAVNQEKEFNNSLLLLLEN